MSKYNFRIIPSNNIDDDEKKMGANRENIRVKNDLRIQPAEVYRLHAAVVKPFGYF